MTAPPAPLSGDGRTGFTSACSAVCGRRPPITWAMQRSPGAQDTMQSVPVPPLQSVPQPYIFGPCENEPCTLSQVALSASALIFGRWMSLANDGPQTARVPLSTSRAVNFRTANSSRTRPPEGCIISTSPFDQSLLACAAAWRGAALL